jgi:hypothetical protein
LISLTSKAKHYLKLGQKQLAMYQIKQKKAVQGILEKRLGSLETLQLILLKISSSQTEAEVS